MAGYADCNLNDYGLLPSVFIPAVAIAAPNAFSCAPQRALPLPVTPSSAFANSSPIFHHPMTLLLRYVVRRQIYLFMAHGQHDASAIVCAWNLILHAFYDDGHVLHHFWNLISNGISYSYLFFGGGYDDDCDDRFLHLLFLSL